MWPRRLVAVAVFAALTAVFAAPLSFRPGTEALDLGPDTRLFLWTLSWDAHALRESPLSVFDANIFFPETNTLAYSEHLLGSALFASPLIWLGAGPVLAMNLVLLASCVLSGLGAYILGRELGLRPSSAFLCGCIYAFSPPRFFRLGQLHLATVQWIPFCLAAFHRYARCGEGRYLLLAVAAFTLQAWSGGQSGLFLALTLSLLGAYLLLVGRFTRPIRLGRDVVLGTVLVLALNVPFALPYFDVRSGLGLERSLAEATFWSPNVESFAASPSHLDEFVLSALGWKERVGREAKAYLFPGWIPLALVGLSLWRRPGSGRRPRELVTILDGLALAAAGLAGVLQLSGGVRFAGVSASDGSRALALSAALFGARLLVDRKTRFASGLRAGWSSWAAARMGVEAGFYLWLLVLSVWASLGPSGGLYSALYEAVPGFDFIRVPSRLTLLAVLALAVLAGCAVERFGRHAAAAGIALSILALAEFAAFPLQTSPYAIVTSPMDAWLAEQPGHDAVAVLPVPDPRREVDSARRHSAYMLGSIAHFRPLVNGYSGFLPPDHLRLFRRLSRFPDEGGVERLAELGVRYVVLHRAGYDAPAWERVTDAANTASGLRLQASFEEGRVYEIILRAPHRGS